MQSGTIAKLKAGKGERVAVISWGTNVHFYCLVLIYRCSTSTFLPFV